MNDIKTAPMSAIKNRKEIEQSPRCGCFKCLAIMETKDVVNWTDKGQTAICPLCNHDSLLPESYGDLNEQSLLAIRTYWFG